MLVGIKKEKHDVQWEGVRGTCLETLRMHFIIAEIWVIANQMKRWGQSRRLQGETRRILVHLRGWEDPLYDFAEVLKKGSQNVI